jgi:hypothetical protein
MFSETLSLSTLKMSPLVLKNVHLWILPWAYNLCMYYRGSRFLEFLFFIFTMQEPISAEPYKNVRSTCVSCQRHNFQSFPLNPSLRERYTPGLWFLPPHRQGLSKEHQLRVAQDHKPFKKCQFPYPTGNFMCVKFLWCFLTCFLSHFLCIFQIYNF